MLTDKPTGKIPLGRPRRRWENNIIIDPKGIGMDTRNWVDSAQDRVFGETCECGIEPLGSINHRVSTTGMRLSPME